MIGILFMATLSSASSIPTCSDKLAQLEDTYHLWTSSTRHILPDGGEQHTYFNVAPKTGQTSFLIFRVERVKLQSFHYLAPCTINGFRASISYFFRVKP